MAPSPIDRPNRPNRPNQRPERPISRPSRPSRPTPRGSGDNRGGGGGRGSGGGRSQPPGSRPPAPSPWLLEGEIDRASSDASFIEYLRWMRSPDSPYKDGTKLQIFHLAIEGGDYRKRLTQLTERTKLIAGEGNTFEVEFSWRVRVGGYQGPENLMLPAFDALGMPYIPSSTLRGIARAQAIREIMARQQTSWTEAAGLVAPWFGDHNAGKSDRAGKVVFLDAYPLPVEKSGGLAVDMVNNIWRWEENSPQYNPNPNVFLSLKEPKFLIGLRRALHCKDPEILNRVKQWLMAGLQGGIGSQVNSGYGQPVRPINPETRKSNPDEFFRAPFSLEGQLIHGRQKFTQWNWNDRRYEWQMRGKPEAEVRPVAFKSMLRYWFRTLTLGVLEPAIVQQWEGTLFGSINPKNYSWIRFEILEGRVTQKEPLPNQKGKNDPCGVQEGILTLSYSPAAPERKRDRTSTLFANLTWMAFHLGGVGQGSRRPCYSRKTRERAPWYRGSSLFAESKQGFWRLPDTPQEFEQLFRRRLLEFYAALSDVMEQRVNPRTPRSIGSVYRDRWAEAVDANCRMVVCSGDEKFNKPFALAVLHDRDFKVPGKRGQEDYDGNLCGQVQGREVKPSPVWVSDLDDFQVVTIFGATQNPRREYLNALRKRSDGFAEIST